MFWVLFLFFSRCILVSQCSSDPAESAFCQDFAQNRGRVQAGAAHRDRYQRLSFLLPYCMFVPHSLPSDMKISIWQRKTPYCHCWLQLREKQKQIFNTRRLFELWNILHLIIWTWNDFESYQLTHQLNCILNCCSECFWLWLRVQRYFIKPVVIQSRVNSATESDLAELSLLSQQLYIWEKICF